MNRILLVLILLFCASTGFARHLKGGFFTYTFLDKPSSTTIRYKITLTVYMECNASGNQIDQSVNFTIFDAGSLQLVRTESVAQTQQYNLEKTSDEKCINGDQSGCYYKILVYELASVELPINRNGYTISYQRCCRIEDINNIVGSGSIGNTYSVTIPGTAAVQGAETNNSARFLVNDTIVVCSNSDFQYPFFAEDPDGDRLVYSFCEAWTGASTAQPAPSQAAAPPYAVVPYNGGFSGSAPFGQAVHINSQTGLISGIAPSTAGEYVITVCVDEYRGNVRIASSRKELHIKVGDCTPIKASLNPQYVTCDGFTFTFQNNVASSEIETYFWDFGVPSSTNDTSNQAMPSFTYPDTGAYRIKLVVNRGLACSDSTTALAKTYPGFFPDFSVAGLCLNRPARFTDNTTTNFGMVNSWRWDFGVTATGTDTSRQQNPAYTYTSLGKYNVRLITTNSVGCVDTVSKEVTVFDKPPLSVAFKDTLICNGDLLPLRANGTGMFSWTPLHNISGENTATPTVQPNTTTKYYVDLDQDGCKNRDSLTVRVVNFVTLQAWSDTVICSSDRAQLGAVSDGLRFQWSPAEGLSNARIKNPTATPSITTTYQVTATIGGCSATDEMEVKAVPYPFAHAGPDTIICYRTPAQLNGSIAGNVFSWTPSSSLTNAQTLTPIARPSSTTAYVLTVFDNIGCPKPGRDTVLVRVLPKVPAFAGRDTAVVVEQLLQLRASGGVEYLWNPATYLSNPDIADPTAVYDGHMDSVRYRVLVQDEAGCVDSAFVTVKIFKTDPRIFVPTAFTPNGDGINDLFRPIAVGISRIEYFRVFNRWGELVFQTTENGKGWDGRINGQEQGSGTFVWLVKGIDIAGKEFFAKGTVTLIR